MKYQTTFLAALALMAACAEAAPEDPIAQTAAAVSTPDLPAYDAEQIHHARVSASDVHRVSEEMLSATRAER